MTCTRGNCKFNFVPCSAIRILFAGKIMNVFALQTSCPVEQFKDKGRENSKVQLGRSINAGLIRGSAKDSFTTVTQRGQGREGDNKPAEGIKNQIIFLRITNLTDDLKVQAARQTSGRALHQLQGPQMPCRRARTQAAPNSGGTRVRPRWSL